MNPNEQCRLCNCSFKVKFGNSNISTENLFNPSKRKGCKGGILAQNLQRAGFEVVKCDKHSSRVCNPSPPPPPLSFFASRFISRAAKTKNLVPRSFFAPKQHGNACYAGYDLDLDFDERARHVTTRDLSKTETLFTYPSHD